MPVGPKDSIQGVGRVRAESLGDMYLSTADQVALLRCRAHYLLLPVETSFKMLQLDPNDQLSQKLTVVDKG